MRSAPHGTGGPARAVPEADAAIEIAKVFPDPTLSFDLTQNREGTVSTGHDLYSELGTTIELFGKRRARIDLAKSGHELSKALLADFYRNMQSDAAIAFLEALKQRQLYSVKLSSYQTMKRLAEADSMRLKSGSIMEIDAIQSKLEAASQYNEVLQSGSDLKNALTQSELCCKLRINDCTLWQMSFLVLGLIPV